MANVSRRRVAWVVLGLFLTLAIPLPGQGSAEKKTDREAAGLSGPVRWVIEEETGLSLRFGKWVEGPRVLRETDSYNPDGNEVVWTQYGAKGEKMARCVYSYDAAGRRVETKTYDALDRLESRTVNEYDSAGKRTSCSWYAASGALDSKSWFQYDATGNQLAQDAYNPDGSLDWRSKSTYDAMGRELEDDTYQADGSLLMQFTRTYSSEGQLVRAATYFFHDGDLFSTSLEDYDGSGNVVLQSLTSAGLLSLLIPPSKTSFKYALDSHGNWIKKTVSTWVSKFGEEYWEPSSTRYRTIAYYGEAAPPTPKTLEALTVHEPTQPSLDTVFWVTMALLTAMAVLALAICPR